MCMSFLSILPGQSFFSSPCKAGPERIAGNITNLKDDCVSLQGFCTFYWFPNKWNSAFAEKDFSL